MADDGCTLPLRVRDLLNLITQSIYTIERDSVRVCVW